MSLAARAESDARAMNFRLLYDKERKLFHIGYDVTIDQVDTHHYDLLASEARLASSSRSSKATCRSHTGTRSGVR